MRIAEMDFGRDRLEGGGATREEEANIKKKNAFDPRIAKKSKNFPRGNM
jgi:hypothetical protein